MGIVRHTQTDHADSDQAAPEERSRVRDLAGLSAALADADPAVRRWAARDLAAFEDAAGPLVRRLGEETDSAVREAILLVLTGIGSPEAVDGLVACLRSEEAALRNEAIAAMQSLPAGIAPIMAVLLADGDPDVRIFAVNVLESLRHADVEKWLIEVIESDPHVNVCATAVDLLGEVGGTAAIAPLQALLARFPDEPYIAFAVQLALKGIHGK